MGEVGGLMTLWVSVIKEKSYDPNFKVKVFYQDGETTLKDIEVDVLRTPPRVEIRYPEEVEALIDKIDRKKLELEILNKVVEHIMITVDKREINLAAFFSKNQSL